MPTKIQWTESTWNPVTGCTKISPGCKHCYAEEMHRRLNSMPNGTKYRQPFGTVVCHHDTLALPIRCRRPTTFFVNSMSDLFHPDVPNAFITDIMAVIAQCPQHTFQVLTKRAERMAEYFQARPVPENAWLGVSVEDRHYGMPRIGFLKDIATNSVRFLSIEPLLEDLGELDFSGIHWVIVGGESGHNARLMCAAWVRNIQNQCQQQSVPFFFKQWSGKGKNKNERALLDGQTYQEYPR